MPLRKISVQAKNGCASTESDSDVSNNLKTSRVQSARSRRLAVHDIFDGVPKNQRTQLLRRASTQMEHSPVAELGADLAVESREDVEISRRALHSARHRSRRNGLTYIVQEHSINPDLLDTNLNALNNGHVRVNDVITRARQPAMVAWT